MLSHVLKLQVLLPLYAPVEEKRVGYFSREFNGHARESQADGEFNYLGSPAHSDSPSTSKEKLNKPAGQVESHYNGTQLEPKKTLMELIR